jgi:hypothetical protein
MRMENCAGIAAKGAPDWHGKSSRECVKHRMPLILGVCAALALVLGACKSKENTPGDAKLKGNTYTNRFFAFQVQIPNTWKVIPKPSKSQVRKGAEAVFAGDKELAAEAAKQSAPPLFMAMHAWGTESLTIGAEQVRDLPGVQSGKDYLDALLEIMTGPGKPLQPAGPCVSTALAGKEFYRVDVAGEVLGVRQQQAIFATVEKGHVLVIMAGVKPPARVEEVLSKVGLLGNTIAQPARPLSLAQVRLQGIGGTTGRRLAIINGKTFAKGDVDSVKTPAKNVVIRCLDISDTSATVTIEGFAGEHTLALN